MRNRKVFSSIIVLSMITVIFITGLYILFRDDSIDVFDDDQKYNINNSNSDNYNEDIITFKKKSDSN